MKTKLNSLELAISNAVQKAYNVCLDVTGCGLYDSAESLLQTLVGIEIGRSWYVFFEATRTKISSYSTNTLRGRPPKRRIRFDLVVWNKSEDTLRAVVEIKRCIIKTASLTRDAQRIQKAIQVQHKASAAYLIVYSTIECTKGEAELLERLANWANDLELKLVECRIIANDNCADGWIEAYALMRAEKSGGFT